MIETQVEQVGLVTIGGGAAVERFDYEFASVLQNIQDVNTDPKAVREVTLKVKVKPNDDRTFAINEIHATSKLAPIKPAVTSMHMSDGLNGPTATEFNPQQTNLNFNQKNG